MGGVAVESTPGGTEQAAPLASHFFAGGPSRHPKVNARACRTAGAVEVASVVVGSPPLWLSLLLEQPSPQLEATSSALAWSAAQASSSSPRFSGRTASPPPMRVVALQSCKPFCVPGMQRKGAGRNAWPHWHARLHCPRRGGWVPEAGAGSAGSMVKTAVLAATRTLAAASSAEGRPPVRGRLAAPKGLARSLPGEAKLPSPRLGRRPLRARRRRGEDGDCGRRILHKPDRPSP